MSGESAPKHRLVLCPKCRKLLQEFPDYDVYKCGGCGTILQAKKRRSGAATSKSSTQETDANASGRVSDDKQEYRKGEQLVTSQENGSKVKATRSSSSSLGECSSNGNDASGQIENGEGNGEHAVLPQENGLREKETISSSGERSFGGNGDRDQIENGECNGEQVVLSQQNGVREKTTGSSSGECSLDGNESNDGRVQIENGECNGEQEVLPKENILREKETSSSSGEHSLDGTYENGHVENDECNGEQEVFPRENELREKETSSSSGEFSLDRNDGRPGQVENGECNGERFGPLSLSDEELEEEMDISKLSDRKRRLSNKGSSNDLSNCEIKASTELIAEDSVINANHRNLQPAREELSTENIPLEGAGVELISASHEEEDANNENLALVGVKSEVHITGSNLEGAEVLNNEDLLPQGAKQELISGLDVEEEANNDDKLAMVGANLEADITRSNKAEKELNISASDGEDPENNQSPPALAKSEEFVSEKGNIAHRKLEEEGISGSVFSPNKQWRQSQKSIRHNSELSGSTLGELHNSQTTRSSHAYYDGSISSIDGVDELLLAQHLDSFENTYTAGANGVPEGRSRKGKDLVDSSMLHGNLETQQHRSYFPGAEHHAPKGRRGDRKKGDEFPSKIPFHRNESQSGYESGSPSIQAHDEVYCSSRSLLSPDSRTDPDEENMKLLRMVYKLQEQLNRTRYSNRETHGRLSTDSYKGKYISAYHSHDLHHEGRFYHHGLDYPRCDGRCGHGIDWRRQRQNFSQQYLAEATRSSDHVDRPCFRCYPQERQFSAKLCMYHLGRGCCSSHRSLPSSPFMSSELAAYDDETKSGDQRYRALESKNYLREKQNLNKRHYRPVAGGAPFVACHKCSKLLKLPAEFLLFKRVCHWLKCGACSEVLKFSLQNRSHIVSYAPNALGQPSSDLDDQNKEVITGGHLNSASHAEPVSHSGDSGHSSEGDPVSMTPPLHRLHGNELDKPSVSHGTFEPITKEKIASRVPSTSETTVSGSEKLPSEMEAMQPPKSSPLHQLMGYSSPSQVFRGVDSTLKGENES